MWAEALTEHADACRVEYFGVKLEGFAFTENGWVQSYGSRYVRPPIIYGDVSRTGPITVKEFKYAQSLTEKPVKGMLTGKHRVLRSQLHLSPCWLSVAVPAECTALLSSFNHLVICIAALQDSKQTSKIR